MFTGSITALVTPMRNGALDEDGFRALVEWQIAEGTHGLVPVGTTGESPTLSHDEHKRVVEICIETAKGRVPVIAGAGSNNTREAIDLARFAEKAGADAVLIVTPYYNKPNQEGLYQHYKAINDAIGIPIIIYNIPPRSVIDMSVETMARLFELKNIVGREGRDRQGRAGQPAAPCHGAGVQPALRRGRDRARLQRSWRPRLHLGHRPTSRRSSSRSSRRPASPATTGARSTYQDRLMPLHQALFIEPNPTGVKYALSVLGRIGDDVRLPLVKVSEPTRTADPFGDGACRADQLIPRWPPRRTSPR